MRYQNFNLKKIEIKSELYFHKQYGRKEHFEHYALVPKEGVKDKNQTSYSVVLVLSGYGSNGSKAIQSHFLNKSKSEKLDQWVGQGLAPKAIYVYVDAMSFWGGSQFIDSILGEYEKHIVSELIPDLTNEFSEIWNGEVNLLGGSSGGYGALHLGSKYPDIFNRIGAIAPDSDFEKSLKPEALKQIPWVLKFGGIHKIFEKYNKEELKLKFQNKFEVFHIACMALCYSGDVTERNQSVDKMQWPFDLETGQLNEGLWQEWLKHDPLIFLKKRIENLKKLKSIDIAVGSLDQFYLQYGTRKISKLLGEHSIKHSFEEFDGTHFDIGEYQKEILSKWL